MRTDSRYKKKDSMYTLDFDCKSFKAFKNIPLSHFLSARLLACMCFLMAIEEEPVRSLSSVMAAMIPALSDMMFGCGLLWVWGWGV